MPTAEEIVVQVTDADWDEVRDDWVEPIRPLSYPASPPGSPDGIPDGIQDWLGASSARPRSTVCLNNILNIICLY